MQDLLPGPGASLAAGTFWPGFPLLFRYVARDGRAIQRHPDGRDVTGARRQDPPEEPAADHRARRRSLAQNGGFGGSGAEENKGERQQVSVFPEALPHPSGLPKLSSMTLRNCPLASLLTTPPW